ncbi:TIGR02281 family clan AA aspartic protease [Parahaliea sp. F7430]|uniref:TIGR02281 family clan AA aspartic protease n=1 Tax=Sediminihaliea albiluteola TaxID=2758564 RepID=A0A7W2TTF1_9GAMM|nr:TIGR02281 family clan AA aspartic protease [Sediminihaliea albiluteola]MBA6411553.1 TIGR02281 family clan AA aspartic protease [Sediminihaliea albiluteola]
MRYIAALLMVLALVTPPVFAGGPQVVVEALLPNTAVMQVNGARITLRAGQSRAGVSLISANSRQAIVEINGKRQTLKLHQRISASYSAPELRQVEVPRDAAMQYRTTAAINGRAVQVLVDTGANVVAMNAGHAAALGIDYRAGQEAQLETAGSLIKAWSVSLQSVDVGGIRVDNVRASITEGDFPSTILLGMTYLQHVQMQEKNGVLLLSREW